jgi:hypothetical protein
MFLRRFQRRISRFPRAFIAWSGVLAFILASFGVIPPLNSITTALVPRERFPCESHACGCTNPHDCWTSCCCHSPAERLAWAYRNHVTPPADVTFSQRDIAMASAMIASNADSCPLCSHDNHDDAASASASPDHTPPISKPALPFPGSASALSCRGVSLWLALPPPLSTRPTLITLIPLPSFIIARSEPLLIAPSRTLEIPVPPPRASRPV